MFRKKRKRKRKVPEKAIRAAMKSKKMPPALREYWKKRGY